MRYPFFPNCVNEARISEVGLVGSHLGFYLFVVLLTTPGPCITNNQQMRRFLKIDLGLNNAQNLEYSGRKSMYLLDENSHLTRINVLPNEH